MVSLTQAEVINAVKQAIADIPHDRVKLTVEPDPAPFGGSIVELAPSDPACAGVRIYIADGDDSVHVEFGRDSVLEIPTEGKWRPLGQPSVIEEVKTLCDAVLQGRITETLWLKNGDVVRSNTSIEIETKKVKLTARHFGRGSVRGSLREVISYMPYDK